MTAYDPEDLICTFCHSKTIFMDYKQGDAVCTSCGLVNSERLVYEGAEWRDFSAVNDEEKKNSQRAGGVVDESRWNGGLEPTYLGPVFGNYSGDGERHRKTLSKVKRVVDHWVDKEFEKKVEDSRLAMKLKEQRKRQFGSQEAEEQDWSGLGTNEHDQIARQRLDEVASMHKMLVSEKWSIDRALLIHGSSDEIPNRYTVSNSFGETLRNAEQERDSVLKRMDTSQRKASEDLYKAYSLIHRSLKQLSLNENMGVLSEVMDAICRYANVKGSLTVKGVSTKIPIGTNTKAGIEEHRSYNKFRQFGAISVAFIYLICKKNGLERTFAEICESFHDESNASSDGAFIKAKHCSKAIAEIKKLMPDYVQSVTVAAAEPCEVQSSKPAALKPDTVASTASIRAATNSKEDHLVSITTNLVEHRLKNMKLSRVAISAITYLVIHMRRHAGGSKRPAIIIAAIAYLVCDAGATMQRLASQTRIANAGEKHIKSENFISDNGKRKHIRPGAARSTKRRQISTEQEGTAQFSNFLPEITSSWELESVSVTPEPERETESESEFDVLLQPVNASRSPSGSSQPPSWSEWKNEKPWERRIKEFETFCSVPSSSAKDYYRKEIYPKRKELLGMLQKCFPHNTDIDGCKADIMMGNIAVASPLMDKAPK